MTKVFFFYTDISIVICRIIVWYDTYTGVEWITFNHGWHIRAILVHIRILSVYTYIYTVLWKCIDLLRTLSFWLWKRDRERKREKVTFTFTFERGRKPSSQFEIWKVVSFFFGVVVEKTNWRKMKRKKDFLILSFSLFKYRNAMIKSCQNPNVLQI